MCTASAVRENCHRVSAFIDDEVIIYPAHIACEAVAGFEGSETLLDLALWLSERMK